MMNFILLFIIYGFLGWIVEVCYVRIGSGKWCNRGFLFMPFLPIYATGAILITLALEQFSNVFVVYVLGVLFTSVLEYITSYVMEKFFHTRWWDYSTYKYNINGRVCLKNSLLFGGLAVLVIFVLNPAFIAQIEQIPQTVKTIIIDVWAACFIVDLAYTLHNVSIMPVRDIRIISGKVKAYSEGKLRSFDEFIDELEDYKLSDGKLREDLIAYTNKVAEEHSIHSILFSVLAVSLVVGYFVKNIIALEMFTAILVVIVGLYVYNRKHHE